LYKVDILPYEVKNPKVHMEGEYITEGIWYRMPYKLHRNVGPNKMDIVCPTTIGKPCPLCQKRQEIFDDPDLDNKLAKDYRASERSLFALKMLSGNKELRGKIVLWDISDFLFFEQLCVELENGEEEWENFPLLEGGYSLKIRLLEEVFDKTKFSKCDRIDFIERDDYDESILEEVPCLDDVVLPNIRTFKEIQAILEGMDSDDEDDDPEDEEDDDEETSRKTKKGSREPRKASKSKPTKGKKRPEPEPDYDADNEEDDDDGSDTEEVEQPESWEELESMDKDELVALAESLDFEIDEDEIDSEDALREAMAEELGIEKPKKGKKKETSKSTKHAKSSKKKPEPEEDDDDKDAEEDDPPPKSKKQDKPGKKADKKAKKVAPGKCPHGHVFGEEFGDHNECDEDTCKKHDACFDEYDSMQDE